MASNKLDGGKKPVSIKDTGSVTFFFNLGGVNKIFENEI